MKLKVSSSLFARQCNIIKSTYVQPAGVTEPANHVLSNRNASMFPTSSNMKANHKITDPVLFFHLYKSTSMTRGKRNKLGLNCRIKS